MIEAIHMVAAFGLATCNALVLGYGFVRMVYLLSETPWRDKERRR